jgi:DNA polymerase
MNRTDVFTEYNRILNEAADWAAGGYRKQRAEETVNPPGSGREDTSPSAGGRGILDGEPGGIPAHEQGSFNILKINSGAGGAGGAGGTEPVEKAGEGAENLRNPGTLREIAEEAEMCRACNLYLIRKRTVSGRGGAGATLMIVTPPPTDGAGGEESPLAGYEQEYLDKWIRALDLDPVRDTFITPAVKCRTPGGRPPHREEVQACSGFLRRQYKAVAPRAVLALGTAACGALTGSPLDFPSLAGQEWTWGAVPALVLWTPAEVLANPQRFRAPVWEALKRLKAAWNAVPGSSV